jgi:hypothetical protein
MKLTTSEMQARVRREVATPSRLGHAALLTASIIVGAGTISLLMTEPSLPERTLWTFAGIVIIAVLWAAYATWVLMRRHVLFGRQRVVASRMACLITLLALGGSIAVRDQVGIAGVITSAVLLLVAVALLVRANKHVTRLTTLAQEFDRQAAQR